MNYRSDMSNVYIFIFTYTNETTLQDEYNLLFHNKNKNMFKWVILNQTQEKFYGFIRYLKYFTSIRVKKRKGFCKTGSVDEDEKRRISKQLNDENEITIS